jgi:hypothetical protein
MNIRTTALSLLGGLVFLTGLVMQLMLSGGVLWGELEARLYVTQSGDNLLKVYCPIMLSPVESGVVSVSVTNSIDEDTSPVVTAEISHVGGAQEINQTLSLAPHESQIIRWPVDISNILFGRLILVNIIQSRYRDLPSAQGACGILLFSLFNLDGIETFSLLLFAGFANLVLGGALWLRARRPLDELAESTARASGILAGVTTAGLLTALPRWWGLTLFLDFVALIMAAVIFTEFILFPRKN